VKRFVFFTLVLMAHSAGAQPPARLPAPAARLMPATMPSIRIASGIGISPDGSILWNAEVLFALPSISDHMRLWIGIIPTTNPEETGDENAADGFVPFTIEYEFELKRSGVAPFLYADAGAGPQFGDASNHSFFQAKMFSAGAGMTAGNTAGFIGKFGLTYNTVLQHSNLYVVLNAGIDF
jgi:hypothetical protein